MNKKLLIFATILVISACVRESERKRSADHKKEVAIHFAALPLEVNAPANNPTTAEKVELGKLLFFDPILSGNKDVACATCHHPNAGFAENIDISIGVDGHGFSTKRTLLKGSAIPPMNKNAHTILNTAFNGMDSLGNYNSEEAPMFWDLRSKGLEAQALEPIKAIEEMRGDRFTEEEILEEIINRLQNIEIYVALFGIAFPESTEPIGIDNLAKAIASYERTILGNQSRFDKYMRGENNALSGNEKEGLQRFIKVGCANCHNGPMFSDYKIHVLGVPDNDKLEARDLGFENKNGFRTPSLRNLRFTFPYMHNGSMRSIKEILEFYEDISNNKSRNPNIPLHDIDALAKSLTLRVKDFGLLTNFLLSLNDETFDKDVPEAVPSGLEVGGSIGL